MSFSLFGHPLFDETGGVSTAIGHIRWSLPRIDTGDRQMSHLYTPASIVTRASILRSREFQSCVRQIWWATLGSSRRQVWYFS
jgi:hypothetical protein